MSEALDEIRDRATVTGANALGRFERARSVAGITILLAAGSGAAAAETGKPGFLFAGAASLGFAVYSGLTAMRRSHEAAAAQQIVGNAEIAQAAMAPPPPRQEIEF